MDFILRKILLLLNYLPSSFRNIAAEKDQKAHGYSATTILNRCRQLSEILC
jgi:hypothetical protein